MKRLLALSFSLIFTLGMTAQVNFGNAVNTLTERLTFSGYAQAGYSYIHRYENTNEFDMKRVSLTVNAQITDRWSASTTLDPKNGTALEYYTDYTVFPFLKAKFGQFKTPYTFENQLSSSVIDLINGGSQAMRYLVATDGSDPMNYKTTGRDLGFMIYGDFLYGLFNYGIAVMNGQGYNKSDGNNHKDIVGRLTFNLGDNFSLGGSFIAGRGHAISGNNSLGILEGANYKRNRWAFGATYKSYLADIMTEVLGGKDGEFNSKGFYATSSIHLSPKLDAILSYDYFNTREFENQKTPDASDIYKNVKSNDFKSILPGEIQSNYIAGLQYWFYPKCRLQVQYIYNDCHINKNSSALLTQLQVAF